MPTFHTFFDPVYDLGGKTNYRLPPRFLRPLISATLCRAKGHNFNGWGNAGNTWDDEAHFRICARCAMRRFESISTQERFDEIMRDEKSSVKKSLAEISALST